jgi:hypothetical protein
MAKRVTKASTLFGLNLTRNLTRNLMKIILPTLFTLAVLVASSMANPAETDRNQWFREARFGRFIHWGVYAVPAGEWEGETIKGPGQKWQTVSIGTIELPADGWHPIELRKLTLTPFPTPR